MAKTERPDWVEIDTLDRQFRSGGRADRRASLNEAIVVVRQGKWSILVTTLVIIGLALFISSRQTPVYRSEGRVLVMPVPSQTGGGGVTFTEPNMATEAELARSAAVARFADELLGTSVTPGLLDGLSVEIPADTEILEIGYRSTDRIAARRTAQAFAHAYLAFREETVLAELQRVEAVINEQLRALKRLYNQRRRAFVGMSDDNPARATVQAELSFINADIVELEAARLGYSETPQVGRIVEGAAIPTSPVSPNHMVNGVFGLIAGLALGVGLAFVRDRLSGRLRSSEEIEDVVGISVLGLIPRVPAWRKRNQPFFVTMHQARSPAAEAYRILRTNILSVASSTGAKSIVVTSAFSGEGKSATAANLGVVLATAGKRVTLVSADLRRPRLHEFFGLSERVETQLGLVDVLSGRAPLEAALLEISGPRSVVRTGAGLVLRIVSSGPIPEDPAELLASPSMEKVVRQVEDMSDIVLIDAPPILPVTDALILAQIAGGVLLVVGPKSMTEATLMSARQHLDRVGTRILGAVMNGHSETVEHSYYGR